MATILLLDDERDCLTLTSMLLSVGGHRTLRASEAADAFALAKLQPPDAIVIDWVRPDISTAISLCLELRMHPQTWRIPIVLIGNGSPAPAGIGLLYDVYLNEPVKIDALLEQLGSLVSPESRRGFAVEEDVRPHRIRQA
jgi:CheY-like chemotaxis protein